jgi:hypothetical protein
LVAEEPGDQEFLVDAPPAGGTELTRHRRPLEQVLDGVANSSTPLARRPLTPSSS